MRVRVGIVGFQKTIQRANDGNAGMFYYNIASGCEDRHLATAVRTIMYNISYFARRRHWNPDVSAQN